MFFILYSVIINVYKKIIMKAQKSIKKLVHKINSTLFVLKFNLSCQVFEKLCSN